PRLAIAEANVLVFLRDGREGVAPIDHDIAEMLRRSRRPVVVAANKVDDPRQAYLRHEVLELGFADPVVMSGHHGIGVDDLLDAVVAALPPHEEFVPGEEATARLAIMGRQNVGKSSLLNKLLGDERALVSPTPGTAHHPNDTDIVFFVPPGCRTVSGAPPL